MLLRPDRRDLAIITLYTARVLLGIGGVLLVPALLGFVWGETNEALAFVVAACIGITLGCAAEFTIDSTLEARWHHGAIVAALAWLAGPFVGAIPLYLSGHYGGFIDAYFDAMSGFTTVGLTIINDLDHLPASVNFWRHFMHFLGGQGLVLIVLSLFSSASGAVGMYVGEAREDKILPNVARTVRFIWRVSLLYLLIGGVTLTVALLHAGLSPGPAVFHAVTLFMSAFDTGGFAPSSASAGLYHSWIVELILGVLMIAGGCSFALHYHLWQGRALELWRSVEARVLACSILGFFTLAAVGLARAGTYDSAEALLRRGMFQVVSAQTTTGFSSIPTRMILTDWGPLAPAAIVFAMGIGAMAGSTAGGIKAIRIALVAKSLRHQLRRLVLPASATTIETYHSGTRQTLREPVVRAALLVLLLYLLLYLLGALAGLFYGYSFEEAMFESTAAASSAGFSLGISGPTMPTGLKVVYTLQMWIGRLEFISVLALFGFLWSTLRGRT